MIRLDGSSLSSSDVARIVDGNHDVHLDDTCREDVDKSRQAVEDIVASGRPAYGINTGFGDLVRVAIPDSDLKELQRNLVRSHACGIGEEMPPGEVLGMMAIRANSLVTGHSGIRWSTIHSLVAMIRAGIAPVVPRIGSLGASGDLAPLSHMALGLMGEGMVNVLNDGNWRKEAAEDALLAAGIEPIILEAKEGLSLINGTSQMCLWISLAEQRMSGLMAAAEVALALSIEGAHASSTPFHERLHQVRPHPGQLKVASQMRYLLSNSPNMKSHEDCEKVQDAYSFRCAPQVLGAIQESLDRVRSTISIELNSTTDNPLIFTDSGETEVISGGNFHGELLGMVSDDLHLAVHEISSISERRIAKLLDPATTGLAAFLAADPGLNSGLMILQYAAAASVAEIRARIGPATATNIVVSAQQEDHVSMGATASWMLLKSIDNCAAVVAAEMITASEALSYRSADVGPNLMPYLETIRNVVPLKPSDSRRDEDIAVLVPIILEGRFI